jgi:hypothetical protein
MERFDSINQRLQTRNIGSTPPFFFSPRPVPTKYVALPMVDQRLPTREIIWNTPFDIKKNFLPATTTPGYARYVDVESHLKTSKHYFPSDKSMMYTSCPTQETKTVLPQWNQSTSVKNNR